MKRTIAAAITGALILIVTQVPAASLASSGIAPLDAQEISASYQLLTEQFYRKTDAQTILDGARNELLTALHKDGFAKAALPKIYATGRATLDGAAVAHEVEAAYQIGGSKIDEHLFSHIAISGMLDSVHDRYTVFLSPKEYAALNQGLDGTDFGGTGIVIGQDDDTKYIVVSFVSPDGPADKAGIQQDDLIVSINGVSTKGFTINQASARLRGKEGTPVTLVIQREGAKLAPITLTRAIIHQLSVYGKMLPNKIGYVEVTVFGRDTGSELTTELNRLAQAGARGVIMDLRDNGGGYLDAAVAVSSKFIPSGPIVSVESRASNITTYEADDDAIAPIPLVVLVNGFTASASEITSGAIQDDGAGTIIGTKTFGKGVVQNIYPLRDGSAIKITTARYLTPHNRDINHLGITPDIVVAENKQPRFGDVPRDVQLQRALDFLNDRIAHLNAGTAPGS
jgi:carboxyl-terminal processing protease